MTAVSELTSQTIKKDVAFVRTAEGADAVERACRQLLSRPLTAETAVQVALLNNKGLQAAYNELALAETDLVEQSLPPNPAFSISRISGDGASEIERQVVGDILALATLPFRSDIARERFRQAQLRAALATLRLAADVRRAYFRAVAANEMVGAARPTRSRPRNRPRSLRSSSARPARSTSSTRPASRCFTPRPPPISPPHGRPRRARARSSRA